MSTNLPPGIDAERVGAWFVSNVPGAAGADLSYQMIGDGRSNITYMVRGNGQTWVLRRPPLGHVIATAHDMAREYRVLDGLAKVDFASPVPIALCEDPEVNGAPFYVMTYCDGVIVHDHFPPNYVTTPAERRAVCEGILDTLAALHSVDYRAVGLGEFGRPEGFMERQLRRWGKQWEANKVREIRGIDELARRLERALPPSSDSSIVHGDYRMGNLILDADDPGRIVAVLDWEMSTLGDPLSDLGYLLGYWAEPTDPGLRFDTRPQLTVLIEDGFMTRRELVEGYARRTGRDCSQIDFYQVFALYKLAVISEGIYHRVLDGKVAFALEGQERQYTHGGPELVEYALLLADRSEIPALRGE
jgi:aminoglycoside phosphotransferase (APT) family kinase protein